MDTEERQQKVETAKQKVYKHIMCWMSRISLEFY